MSAEMRCDAAERGAVSVAWDERAQSLGQTSVVTERREHAGKEEAWERRGRVALRPPAPQSSAWLIAGLPEGTLVGPLPLAVAS